VTAVISDARQKAASEGQNSAVDRLLVKIVPDRLKNCLPFSFVLGLGHVSVVLSSMAPQTWKSSGLRSGELGGHSSFLMQSGLCCSSQSCASLDA